MRSERCATVLLVIALSAQICLGQSDSSAEFKKLYDDHRCFEMRERVSAPGTPLFYRAVAACNFREDKACRKELQQVQREMPASDDAWEATSLLAENAVADGRYTEALAQVNTQLRLRPSNQDAQNARAFFGALAAYGDQKLVRRKPGSIPVVQFEGNVGATLTTNGREAAFIFDTGANFSVISESQAKLLGLAVHEVNAKVGVATGASIGFRIADAKTVQIGNVELRNVAFLVVGDDAEPFVELPDGHRGILGLPALMATQTLHMHNGIFDVSYKPAKYNRKSANMCAYGPTLSVQLKHDDKLMSFALDTGAIHTDLYTPFASAFPAMMAIGHKETFTEKGVGSTEEFPIVALPPVSFDLAGHHVVLSPARVFLKPTVAGNSETFFGNLGMDLLGQAKELSFDFRAMQISLH